MIFRILVAFLGLFVSETCFSQSFKILHYTETSGFDHGTRADSYTLFRELGMQSNFTVDDDSTGSAFDTPDDLAQYKVVVFSNTSGDAVLDATQRNNFELYISNGGNVIGIHAASDTYRHSTASGTNTGTWDFYPELIGASVQQNPNHVSGTPFYNIYTVENHPLLNAIPDPWYKAEEYYYWESGYFDAANNHILQKVESTIGPNGQVNSYDSSRATAWYKILSGNNRIFYTSLGHERSNFTVDAVFKTLLLNAVLWTAGLVDDVGDVEASPLLYYSNPITNSLLIKMNENFEIRLFDSAGRLIQDGQSTGNILVLNTIALNSGVYFLQIKTKDHCLMKEVMKGN